MMQAKYLVLALVALLCIVPAMALTETITLQETNTTAYGETLSGSLAGKPPMKQFIINFDNTGYPSHYVFYFVHASGNKNTTSSDFEIRAGSKTVGLGTVTGMNGSFMGGAYDYYLDYNFNYWDQSGLSGTVYTANITFSDYRVNNSVPGPSFAAAGLVPRYMSMRVNDATPYPGRGYHLYYQTLDVSQTWTITNVTPISKNMLFDWSVTRSGLSIPNIYSNNTLLYAGSVGDYTVSGSAVGADLIAQMHTPATGVRQNSSLLFLNYLTSGGIPATPAPTPTPAGTTMITQYFECIDGASNGRIYDCDVDVLDVTSGTWANATATYGSTSFAILNTHTMDAYGSASGYSTATRTGLSPFDGFYQLIMQPDWAYCSTPGKCGGASDPGDGNINLIIMVDDYATDDPIGGASISLVEPSGATTTGTTNDAGVGLFAFTNKTQVNVKVSKSGYSSASKMWTTSAFGPDTVHIQLNKLVVTQTPTVTYTNAQGTVVPTLDTRSTAQKDASMMDQVRDAGPGLISLAILATMFGLIRMMAK